MKQYGYGGPSDQTPILQKSGCRPVRSVQLNRIKGHLRLQNTTSSGRIASLGSATINYIFARSKYSPASSHQVTYHAQKQ